MNDSVLVSGARRAERRCLPRDAGLDNPLFYMDKTMMVFGDAKKVVEDLVKAID